jgi:PAS domain S-box-containing protein
MGGRSVSNIEQRDGGNPTTKETESIQELVMKLVQVEAELQTILGGEVDAVLDPNSKTPILMKKSQEALLHHVKQLAQERQRYRDLFEFAPDGYLVTDTDSTILEANQAAAGLLGAEQDLLAGKLLSDFISHDDLRHFHSMLDQLKLNEKVFGWESTLSLPGGDGLPVVMIVASQRDLGGSPLSLRWQLHDISERKLAAESLRASQQKLQSIVTGAPILLWAVDPDKLVTYFEGKSLNTVGVTGHSFLGRSISEFFLDSPEVLGFIDSALTGEEVLGTLIARGRFLETRFSPLRDSKKEITGVIGVSIDITAQKQLEADLTELNNRLVQGREKDRLQLSRDIHDGPVQDMYGILFHLKAFSDNLPADIDREPVRVLQTSLGQVVDTLRMISGELRPPTLAPFGLEKAIRSHAALFQEANPQLVLELNLMADGQELPELVRLALFRIYQHALSNVHRHANAKTVLVKLEITDDQIILAIQDDGDGFRLPDKWIEFARNSRLGLIDAMERAHSIGGQLLIETEPGKGTILRTVIAR